MLSDLCLLFFLQFYVRLGHFFKRLAAVFDVVDKVNDLFEIGNLLPHFLDSTSQVKYVICSWIAQFLTKGLFLTQDSICSLIQLLMRVVRLGKYVILPRSFIALLVRSIGVFGKEAKVWVLIFFKISHLLCAIRVDLLIHSYRLLSNHWNRFVFNCITEYASLVQNSNLISFQFWILMGCLQESKLIFDEMGSQYIIFVFHMDWAFWLRNEWPTGNAN